MTFTVKELKQMGKIGEVIDHKGWNPYCIAEGMLSDEDDITLSVEEVEKLNLFGRQS